MKLKLNKEWLTKMADEEDKVSSVSCGAWEQPLTWRQRLRMRLFPSKHCFAPESPGEWKDCVTVHSTTKLDWIDRLRALITGVICVTCRTVTENEVGNTKSASTCHIGTSRDLAQ